MVRAVDSFMKCRFTSASRTSSAVEEPRSHRTSITRCSRLLRLIFTLSLVALHNVAKNESACKEKTRSLDSVSYNVSVPDFLTGRANSDHAKFTQNVLPLRIAR